MDSWQDYINYKTIIAPIIVVFIAWFAKLCYEYFLKKPVLIIEKIKRFDNPDENKFFSIIEIKNIGTSEAKEILIAGKIYDELNKRFYDIWENSKTIKALQPNETETIKINKPFSMMVDTVQMRKKIEISINYKFRFCVMSKTLKKTFRLDFGLADQDKAFITRL